MYVFSPGLFPALIQVLIWVLLLSGCSTVPETGRSQLLLVDTAQEAELGLKAFSQKKAQTPISRNAKGNARLQRVGKRIASVVKLPHARWELVLFDVPDEPNAYLAMQAYGLGTQLGVLLPYSRTQELEADQLGLMYMARAGFDPKEAIAFWRRFQAYNAKRGGRPPEFLSTHPLDDNRIAQLQRFLPRAEAEYRRVGGRR